MEDEKKLASFWRDELSNFFDDGVRVNAARNCHLIAREIGVNTVLDSLEECLLPVEISDAVFHNLAESLGEKEFEGSKRAFRLMVWLLEYPEKIVRKASVKSVIQHAHRGQVLVMTSSDLDVSKFDYAPIDSDVQMNEDENGALLLPALCDLTRFKSFFQRISVCEIYSHAVPTGMDEQQEEDMITRLAKDQVPQVRFAVAECLGKIWSLKRTLSKQGVQHHATEIRMLESRLRCTPLGVVRDLMLDPDDVVQAAAVEHCLCMFLSQLDPENRTAFLREELAHSPSWRARLGLAKQMKFLLELYHELHNDPRAHDNNQSRQQQSTQNDMDVDNDFVDKRSSPTASSSSSSPTVLSQDPKNEASTSLTTTSSSWKDEISSIFVEMFTDPEPDVRAEAVRNLEQFGRLDDYIRDTVGKLVDDEDTEVRKAVLSSLHYLAKYYPAETAQLLNRVLMTDPEPEVRTKAVSVAFALVVRELPQAERLSVIRNIYGITCSSEGRAMSSFSWRTKNEAILALPYAVQYLQRDVWANDAAGLHFFQHCLQDTVHSVRESAIAQLPCLARGFGLEWVKSQICPLPETLYSKSDYRVRICALELLYELYKAQCFTDKNAEIVRSASNDPVQNVRTKVAMLFPSI